MRNFIIISMLFLISTTAFSQASGSTEFEIEIHLLDSSTIYEYEFYAIDNQGINSITRCA